MVVAYICLLVPIQQNTVKENCIRSVTDVLAKSTMAHLAVCTPAKMYHFRLNSR